MSLDVDEITRAVNVAKAWATFNGAGTLSVSDSYNVDSVTDNGTGDYSVNFTVNFANVNYSVAGTTTNSQGPTRGADGINSDPSNMPTVSLYRLNTFYGADAGTSGAKADNSRVCVAFFGDQA